MKIIKDYQRKEMKRILYDGSDAVELKKRFLNLKPELIDRLCKWLTDNDEFIDADDCFDAQSGWRGTNFTIGKANLSCNGYCLRNENIELFLAGGQSTLWYNFWEPEFRMAKEWQEKNRQQ